MDNTLIIKQNMLSELKGSIKIIIDKIFKKNIYGVYTTILDDQNSLPQIFNLLIESNDKEKLEIIKLLIFMLENNRNNFEIFNNIEIDINQHKISIISFFSELFIQTNDKLIQEYLINLLELIINNIDLQNNDIQVIFQGLSKFFYYADLILYEKLLEKYLNLLKILYGSKFISQKPYNYFYFSGNSSIIIDLNSKTINIQNGVTFLLFFKVEEHPNSLRRSCSDLITLKSTKNIFKLGLLNNKIVYKIQTSFEEIDKINSGFNSIIVSLRQIKVSSVELQVSTNDYNKILELTNFSCSEIEELKFFHNFIGQVSSIFVFTKYLHEESLSIPKEMQFGIYNEKLLMRFLKKSNISNHNGSNSFFKQTKPGFKEDYTKIFENLKILLIPTRYDPSINLIYDVLGSFNASIYPKEGILNGVHYYRKFHSNIANIGGLNILVPILELAITKNLINENILLKFLEIIYCTILYKKNNISNAKNQSLFPLISIFLENFPREVFSQEILEILLKIGKSLFSLIDNNNEVLVQFFDEILLNEKILIKFSYQDQIELWERLFQFYVSDISQIKNFMSMKKIRILLRYYDRQKYKKFCCQEHKNLFEGEIGTVMEPSMKAILENLMNIVQLMINQTTVNDMENLSLLLRLLSFDLSPCLMKSILSVFNNFLTDLKISDEIKKHVINKLIDCKESIIDLLLYNYNLAMMDVRCDIISILNELSSANYKEVFSRSETKIYAFLYESLLPSTLKVKSKSEEFVEMSVKESASTKKKKSQDSIFEMSGMFAKDDIDSVSYFEEERINQTENLSYKIDDSNISVSDFEKALNQDNEKSFEIRNVNLNLSLNKSVPMSHKFVHKLSTNSEQYFQPESRNKQSKMLNIDIDDINKLYKFGGEKLEANKSKQEIQKENEIKIKNLAIHCVQFMQGKIECSTKQVDPSKSFNIPHPLSVKGNKNILFGLQKTISYNSKKVFSKRNVNDGNFSQLEKRLNKDIYVEHIQELYLQTLNWLFNKKSNEKKIFFANVKVISLFTVIVDSMTPHQVIGFLNDMGSIFIRNQANCISILKVDSFLVFLLHLSFKFYLISTTNPNDALSNSIHDMSKRLFCNILLNGITNEIKSLSKINLVLNWGINEKQNSNNQVEVNNFIQQIFRLFINEFTDKLKLITPSILSPSWENYMMLNLLFYEFVAFYNLQKNLENESFIMLWKDEKSLIPTGIYSGLNYQFKPDLRDRSTISKIWIDYKVLDQNYSNFSNYLIKKLISDFSITHLERLATEFILNKKSKDQFLDHLKILFHQVKFENQKSPYGVTFAKAISNFFVITLTVIREIHKYQYWINEYQKFLVFLIVSCTNLVDDSSEFYNYIHDSCIEIVCFGIIWLSSEYFANNITNDHRSIIN